VLSDPVPDCPAEATCVAVDVTCPGIKKTARAELALAYPTGTPTGMVTFFSPSAGLQWFSSLSLHTSGMLADLRTAGLVTAEVRWTTQWYATSKRNDAGTAHVACRPATVIQHLHDGYYVPLGVAAEPIGQCGFCVTGQSGGANQAAYALTHFELGSIVDAVILVAGPPYATLRKSCQKIAEEQPYWFPFDSERQAIDTSFGHFSGTGPCYRHETAAPWPDLWLAEGIATGGFSYFYPTTRVAFVFGALDQKWTTVARDYESALVAAGMATPMVGEVVVANTTHKVYATVDGRAAWLSAITWSAS